MKRGKKVLIILIILILTLILALIWWLPSFVMTGDRQTLEDAFAWQSDHYDLGCGNGALTNRINAA